MAFSFVQASEAEFREFGCRHFPSAAQPTFLPPFVTPSTDSRPPKKALPLHPAIFDTAYNAGFTAGAHVGHATGHAAGYAEGYNAAHARLGVPCSDGTAPAEEPVDENENVQSQTHHGDDEGLGFYPDGVERTLDDDAIQFFRRSELREMLKAAKRRLADRRECESEIRAECDVQMKEEQLDRSESEQHDDARETKHEAGAVDTRRPMAKASDLAAPDAATNHSTSSTVTAEPSSTTPDGPLRRKHSEPPGAQTKMTAIPDVGKGKKRKRLARDSNVEDEGITYRRIARELDEMPAESVQLDY